MPRWSPEEARQIVSRVVVEGMLELLTPAHFGSGEQNGTELIILTDALDGSPLLPGASIAGALRHYLLRRERGYRVGEDVATLAAQLFGEAYDEDKGTQSHVILDDAPGTGTLTLRDGVMLEGKRRTAKEKALFSVQVWDRGTTFKLRFELCLCAGDDGVRLLQGFAAALTGLQNGEIPLGSRKHRGYGEVSVSGWQVRLFDMTTAAGIADWIQDSGTRLDTADLHQTLGSAALDDARESVRIKLTCHLRDSMLIRAGSDVSDAAHLMTGSQPILSGTSLTGALRARALRIAQTLYRDGRGQHLIDDLFGKHGSSDNENDEPVVTEDLTASRLLVKERVIEKSHMNAVQNWVRIDRFTGGAFETALFSEQPVFADDATQVEIDLTLQIGADTTPYRQQIGLLLLVMKDLWTEDLPLGGESSVGRGRLRGVQAEIHFHLPGEWKGSVSLNRRDDGLQIVPVEAASFLEGYVADFVSWEGQPS